MYCLVIPIGIIGINYSIWYNIKSMIDYKKHLSENLKDLMKDMSVSTLSEKVNIPQPTLTRYLQCKRQITLENLIKLADYFDVDIDILIGRKDY